MATASEVLRKVRTRGLFLDPPAYPDLAGSAEANSPSSVFNLNINFTISPNISKNST